MHTEEARLRKLYQMELLDTPAEKDFDDIVLLASQIARTPISLITLLDHDRQWFKANVGMEGENTDRESAVCNYTIQSDELFEVENLSADKRFSKNKHITGGAKLRYYAGVPLTTSDGFRLGSLCVLDTKPRARLSEEQVFALKTLARQAMRQIELRVLNRELQALKKINARVTAVIEEDFAPVAIRMHKLALKLGQDASADDVLGQLRKLGLPANFSDHTLNNIISWSKIQRNIKAEVTTSVATVLEECLAPMQKEIDGKDNTVVCEIDESVSIPLDKEALSFILRNLLHNANKYTSGGTITVRHFYNSGSLTKSSRHYLSVTDTGIGIQPYDIEAFNQGAEMRVRKGTAGETGTGNGLLLTGSLLQRFGGKLHLESKVGGQTSAIIIF